MIELIISVAGVLLVLLFARIGWGVGAFRGLAQLLTALVAMLIAIRAWFFVSHALSALQAGSMPALAVCAFWIVFVLLAFMFTKLRETYTEVFESVQESPLDRLLGAVFGLGTGALVVTALAMSASILALQYWPDFNPEKLPLPLDRAPLNAYRWIETNVAQIGPNDAGHAPLPSLKREDVQNPKVFWE